MRGPMQSDMPMKVKTVRLSVKLWQWVEAEAQHENRSVNNFLWTLLAREQVLRQRERVREVSA